MWGEPTFCPALNLKRERMDESLDACWMGL
jgi:hypothetical protein